MKIINKITTLLVALLLMNINVFTQPKTYSENSQPMKTESKSIKMNPVKMTVLYDNYVFTEGTKNAWGFSCFIEGTEKKSRIPVYLPHSFPGEFIDKVKDAGASVILINEPAEICKGVYSTGEMEGRVNEQSLIVKTNKGIVVVTGCSHPGIVNIVKKAQEIMGEEIYLVFGGFHLKDHSEKAVKEIISQFRELGVKKCGATHCTGDKQINLFKEAYGNDYIEMGTGRVLEF